MRDELGLPDGPGLRHDDEHLLRDVHDQRAVHDAGAACVRHDVDAVRSVHHQHELQCRSRRPWRRLRYDDKRLRAVPHQCAMHDVGSYDVQYDDPYLHVT
jgi:hypothetical protein